MFQVSNTRAKMFLGLVLAGLLTSAGTVSARANDRKTDSIHVAARDLDLRTQTGASTLRHRVLVAAHKVCDRLGQGDPMSSDAFAECVRETAHTASQQAETLIAAAQGPSQLAAAGPSR